MDTFNCLLYLPSLVVDNIISFLSCKDRQSVRSTCKRLYQLTLSNKIFKKMKMDLTYLRLEDVDYAQEFLKTIDYGSNISFQVKRDVHANSTAAIILKLAKNLRSFRGDISWTGLLSTYCPSLKFLELVVPYFNRKNDTEMCRSMHHFNYLETFGNLKDLQIQYDGELPISIFHEISTNATHLTTLGFSHIHFIRGKDGGTKYIEEDETGQEVMYIDNKNILHWIFKEVWVLGFSLVLPSTTMTISMISSLHITWNRATTHLQKLCTDCPSKDHLDDILPPNVDDFTVHLPGWTLCNLLISSDSIYGKRNYRCLTVASFLTSKVIENIMNNVGVARLTELHLTHLSDLPWSHKNAGMIECNSKCNNKDVIEICKHYSELTCLVLENLDGITKELIQDLSQLRMKLRFLRLVGCKSFQNEDIGVIQHDANIYFHVEISQGSAKKSIFPPPFPGPSFVKIN